MFITLAPKDSQQRFLIRWLNSFEFFLLNLIGWFINMSVQTFQLLIVIFCNMITKMVYNEIWSFSKTQTDVQGSAIFLSLQVPVSSVYLNGKNYNDL